MKQLLGKLIRLLILLVLAPLICSCSLEALSFLSSNLDLLSLDWFAIGFVVCVLVYAGASYTRGRICSDFQFLRTLRHELAHAVTAMLTGGRIDRMEIVNPVERPGEIAVSAVEYASPVGPVSLISLAPYYLPLFTIPLLPLRFFVISWVREVIDFLIGFTLGFHYVSFMDEFLGQRFGLGQTDIRKTGAIFSYVIIGFFNLLSLATVKAVLHNDWPARDQLTRALVRGWEWYVLILQELRRYAARLQT